MDIYQIFIDLLTYLAQGAGNMFIKSMDFIFSFLGLAGLAGFLICLVLWKFKDNMVRMAFYIIIVLLLLIVIISMLDINLANLTLPALNPPNEWTELK